MINFSSVVNQHRSSKLTDTNRNVFGFGVLGSLSPSPSGDRISVTIYKSNKRLNQLPFLTLLKSYYILLSNVSWSYSPQVSDYQ